MIKEFKAKRAARKRKQQLAAYRAEMKEARSKGLEALKVESEKYFADKDKQADYRRKMWESWYTFLSEKEQEAYLRAAESWYRLRFGDTEGNLPQGDLTWTGQSKTDLLEIEDLRRRMWETLYPDEVYEHNNRIRVQEDTHTDVSFILCDDGLHDIVRNGVREPNQHHKK